MKGMRWQATGVIVAISLALGTGLGWAIWGRGTDFSARVADIVEINCVPFVRDNRLVTTGLVDINGPHPMDYADEATALMVSFGSPLSEKRNCVLSDVMRPVDPADWTLAYDQLVDTWTPRLRDWNGEPPVALDLSDQGVGAPQLILRPRGKDGYHLGFIKFKFAAYSNLNIGYGTFNAPVNEEEDL